MIHNDTSNNILTCQIRQLTFCKGSKVRLLVWIKAGSGIGFRIYTKQPKTPQKKCPPLSLGVCYWWQCRGQYSAIKWNDYGFYMDTKWTFYVNLVSSVRKRSSQNEK